jgi:gamma-butyrobetaine dioxygenase
MVQVTFEIKQQPASVIAQLPGESIALAALWLRERCQDAASLDVTTQQRLFNPHKLPDGLTLLEAEAKGADHAWLSFSDGYAGFYDLSEFRADFDPLDGLPTPISWKSDIDTHLIYMDFNRLTDFAYRLHAFSKFLTYGILIIQNVPTEAESVLDVAKIFGQVRETNFGKYFEVYSRADSNDLAYRSIHLDPHTDNPYRDPMPGIQLLHCLINETSGGLSTLVDSLAVAERLKLEDPEGFDLLVKVPVRYRHVDKDVELIERRPIIMTDALGRMTGVSYSPRLDYLPLLNAHDMAVFHRARRRMGELFVDPVFERRFKLEKGELQMFNNTRVLHGRTSFDTNEGSRHLQGCYMDMDGPKGIYKAMKRSLKAR